jgi:hypothetical protein
MRDIYQATAQNYFATRLNAVQGFTRRVWFPAAVCAGRFRPDRDVLQLVILPN